MQGNPNYWRPALPRGQNVARQRRDRLAHHAAARAFVLAAALLVALWVIASIFDGVLP